MEVAAEEWRGRASLHMITLHTLPYVGGMVELHHDRLGEASLTLKSSRLGKVNQCQVMGIVYVHWVLFARMVFGILVILVAQIVGFL